MRLTFGVKWPLLAMAVAGLALWPAAARRDAERRTRSLLARLQASGATMAVARPDGTNRSSDWAPGDTPDMIRSIRCWGRTAGDDDIRDVGLLAKVGGFWVNGSSFTDRGVRHLAALRHLRFLEVTRASITDAAMADIARMSELTDLRLIGVPITDVGIAKLAHLDRLVELQLDSTGLTDAGVQEICRIKTLQALSLSRTGITDASFDSLKSLSNLVEVNLAFTEFSYDMAYQLLLANPRLESIYPWPTNPDGRPALTSVDRAAARLDPLLKAKIGRQLAPFNKQYARPPR
jgi:hypothetical protein